MAWCVGPQRIPGPNEEAGEVRKWVLGKSPKAQGVAEPHCCP